MFQRIYVEIGNLCNLNCSFCPPLKRAARQMTEDEFLRVCKEIRSHTDHIYLHVMGEPLLHPLLSRFLDIAASHSLKVSITTNGTLLARAKDMLLSKQSLHKVSVSLHCLEDNLLQGRLETYLDDVCDFAEEASNKGIYTVLRLWNLDSAERKAKNGLNKAIETYLAERFCGEWVKRPFGFRLARGIFLEYSEIFTWPTESTEAEREQVFCHGMRDQIAVLSDGTVVPCCLDSEGEIPLGNIFLDPLDSILSSPRAVGLAKGLAGGNICEPLCRKCSYSMRFSK